MLRRLVRTLPLLTLSLVLVGGCKQSSSKDADSPEGKQGGRKNKGDEQAKKIVLPEPLELPADPPLATWLTQPNAVVARIQPYSPIQLDVRMVMKMLLANVTRSDLATLVADSIDLERPFANVVLPGGQEIVRVEPMAGKRDALVQALASLPKAGEFGAVALPPPDGAPAGKQTWLAWLDPQDGTLVLSTSDRGLASGRGMAAAYGKEPVFFTVDAAAMQGAAALPVELPFGRVWARGNLDELHVEAELAGDAQADPLSELPIAQGTLGGLLAAPKLTLGASSRYSEHEQSVKDIIRQVNSQVDQLPFLVRGIGEDLAKKLNTVLRSWDGRVLAAIGPVGHVRIAYGSEDPDKAKVAMIRLLQAIVDNLKFFRNFSSDVPNIALKRDVAQGDGTSVDLLVVHDAGGLVPSELRSLLDAKGKLNVAMAWSPRAGGGVMMVGPQASDELAAWLDATKASPSGADTAQELLAAMLGAHPDGVRTLVQQGEPQLDAVLGLAPADSPHWSVSIDKQDRRYVLDLVDLTKSGSANAKPPRAR